MSRIPTGGCALVHVSKAELEAERLLARVDRGERGQVAVLEAGWAIVAEPWAQKYSPESVVDAQFSMPFGAAVAALEGAAGLRQFTIGRVRSPQVREFMKKVEMVKDPSIEETFPAEWPARVAIETENGQRVEQFVRYPKGDPENPLTWDEMCAKFRSLASEVISDDRCDDIIAAVRAARPSMLPALCCQTGVVRVAV